MKAPLRARLVGWTHSPAGPEDLEQTIKRIRFCKWMIMVPLSVFHSQPICLAGRYRTFYGAGFL